MSEFKGTKGKWVLNKHIIESDLGCDIAEIWDYNDEENQANALLISKAPEMLQMLVRCNEVIELLDCANSDLINEINKSTKCPDNRKYKTLSLEIKQLIKQATEI